MGFSTDAIHIGQEPDKTTGAVVVPIYQTTTYHQEEIGVNKGYLYSRSANPTRTALETNIAALEKGRFGLAFTSGVAALHSIAMLLKPGEHLLISKDVYGGTYRLFESVMKDYGLECEFIDFDNPEGVKNSIKQNTKLVHIESPTNPLLKLVDIRKIGEICKANNLILSCDNTFMSPYLQNPLLLGVDIVIHSTTKYLGGHSDVIGGVVVTNDQKLYERMKFIQNSIGAVPSPFDCWLVLRSVKTLALRMEKHCSNAFQVAEFLLTQKNVKKVYYPGLLKDKEKQIADSQMKNYGGMVSCDLENFEEVKRFLKKLKIFTLAESLGGVESLVCHPPTMTHKSMPKEEQEKAGLKEGLVRLSIGIEDAEDLINDLEQALN